MNIQTCNNHAADRFVVAYTFFACPVCEMQERLLKLEGEQEDKEAKIYTDNALLTSQLSAARAEIERLKVILYNPSL